MADKELQPQPYKVGDEVECRNKGCAWLKGVVTSLAPSLKVMPHGEAWKEGFTWQDVRAVRAKAEDSAQPPLFDAAQADDVEKIKSILASKVDVGMRHGPFAWTALHVAGGYGAASATDFLIKAGISVNARSSDGETPLHIAAQQGCDVGIKVLLENRAEIDAPTDDGETPLHIAVQHIGAKDTAGIVALLEQNADPSIKDLAGLDACGHARVNTNRQDEILALLGSHGAKTDDSASSEAGGLAGLQVALGSACTRGKIDDAKMLLDMSTDPAQAAQQMVVPAAKGGHVEVMEMLLARKADLLSAVDQQSGSTPLIAAADESTNASVKMIKWLLAQKVDANQASRVGVSALMAASLRGSDEIASALLAANADVNHRAFEGWTALMVACQSGRDSVAKLLLDAGAQMDATTSGKKTAKDLAADNSHGGVVKLLEMRLKLNSRRAKVTQDKARTEVSEDTRDMEALLADLGETSASTGAGKTKKKSKAKAAPPTAPQAKTESVEESHSSTAGQGRGTAKAKAKTQPVQKTSQVSKATKTPDAAENEPAMDLGVDATSRITQEAIDTVDTKLTELAEPPELDRCAALRSRLQEIDKIRTDLAEEELSIRKELRQLEAS